MANDAAALVQKFWNFCNVLRDDGVSYGDYVEQLTYLLFLKIADEKLKYLPGHPPLVPPGYDWESLRPLDGDALETQYRHILGTLGKESGLLGLIFRKSQNKIQDPAKLKRLLSLIDQEMWSALKADVKSDLYEGLLEKNAQDVKSGAGQYFTPRELIKAMVTVMRPEPGLTICDPACGTGGFFIAAYDDITRNYPLDKKQKQALKEGMFWGWEIVDAAARLCAMNLYLHGIGARLEVSDSLARDPGNRFDMVLTNPPFGKKSSITIVNGEGRAEREAITYERQDFWATTSNKQLNFLQHVKSILEINGRAAIVVPDNVLFEGGAGETIRRKLLDAYEVHTLLRLPTGIFYSQGVKANVLFFDRRPASEKPWTEKLWIYDFRTNQHFTLKTNTLRYEHLADFIKCYNPENRHQRQETGRFRAFPYEELSQRDKASLDIFWLKDESLEDLENLPEPDIIAREIADNLQAALEIFSSIYEELEKG
jgi:type I restriction enzyme M protein